MASKLFNIRCDNCGSEYRINSRGEMNCPFCGSKIYLNDKDFEEFLKARDEMLLKDKATTDHLNDSGDVIHKWNNELQIFLDTASSQTVNLKYFYQYHTSAGIVYVGRNRVSIIFNESSAADKFINNTTKVQYPSADIKKMEQFLPALVLDANLKDHKRMLVLNKPENVYPLALFTNLDPKQVAWMISRMENFGCLLEFSHLDFPALAKTDLYINPKTHHMYLLGGWETVTKLSTKNQYLRDMRLIAKALIGSRAAPKMCTEFLDSEPAPDAYTDFQKWDDVIVRGCGGHNFHHFTET